MRLVAKSVHFVLFYKARERDREREERLGSKSHMFVNDRFTVEMMMMMALDREGSLRSIKDQDRMGKKFREETRWMDL